MLNSEIWHADMLDFTRLLQNALNLRGLLQRSNCANSVQLDNSDDVETWPSGAFNVLSQEIVAATTTYFGALSRNKLAFSNLL